MKWKCGGDISALFANRDVRFLACWAARQFSHYLLGVMTLEKDWPMFFIGVSRRKTGGGIFYAFELTIDVPRHVTLSPHVFADSTGDIKGISPKVASKLGIISTEVTLCFDCILSSWILLSTSIYFDFLFSFTCSCALFFLIRLINGCAPCDVKRNRRFWCDCWGGSSGFTEAEYLTRELEKLNEEVRSMPVFL